MSETAREILRCPFCGGRGIADKSVTLLDELRFGVVCARCGTTNDGFRTMEQAIAAWEKRVDESERVNNAYQQGYKIGFADGKNGATPPETKALLEALRKLDLDCDYCANRDEYKKKGIACEGDCSECGHAECHCQTCLGNSKWEWKG